MTHPALHPTPRPRDVLLEQARAVGLSLRWPAAAAAALVGVVTLLVVTDLPGSGEGMDFRPEHQMLPGVLGLLLPVALWRGEDRSGAGFLWTLPVDRRRHALTRVGVGWGWLMCAVALFVLWQLGVALLTGGSVLAGETLRLVPGSFPDRGTLDPAALRSVRWTPEPLLWLVPFTAATGTYLLASALALGPRHPLRWMAGAALAVFLFAAASDAAGRAADAEWLVFAPSRLLASLLYGPYGLDALLTARTESLKTLAALPGGETVVVWRGLPDPGRWAAAALLWTGAGLAAVWAAASRHRERRRG